MCACVVVAFKHPGALGAHLLSSAAWIESAAAALDGGGGMCHVELMIEGSRAPLTLTAVMNTGVVVWEGAQRRAGWDYVRVPGLDVDRVRKFAWSVNGAEYDLRGAVLSVMPGVLRRAITRGVDHDDDAYFCSEVVLRALAEGGFETRARSQLVSPNALYDMLHARRGSVLATRRMRVRV